MSNDNKLTKREGRPSKLSTELVSALETVAENDREYVLFTDEELVAEINDQLPKDKRISYNTFRNYMRESMQYKGSKESKTLSEFLLVLKRIRRNQKKWLTENMLEAGAGSWQKFGWIGERKFDDLNLTKKVDHTTGGDSFNKIVIQDAFEEIDEAEVVEED